MGNSAPTSGLSPRRVVVVALLLIYVFGANALYGLLYRNGYYRALIRLRDEGPHHLPGSSNAILTRYTRIVPLDKLLTLAGVMFANVTDGSTPELSLYAFHFGGQYLAILVVIAIEGLRNGNQSNVLRLFSVWGCLMQATSYGCTMPLYGMIHLTTSPVSQAVGPALSEAVATANASELSTLPQAFMIGYVVPAVLMSIPVFSNPVHQWFGGLWQGSPIYAMLMQKMLAARRAKHRSPHSIRSGYKVCQWALKQPPARNSQSPVSMARSQEKGVLARNYSFAFAWCIISQAVPLALIAAVRLDPAAFPPELRDAWTISNVFAPPPFWSSAKMESMATGMHDFFLYDQYVGSTAAIVWSATLYVNARETSMTARSWGKLACVIAALSVAAGPAGAVVWMMWERDQVLLSLPRKGF
ncbi:hypothetical protein GGR54DRAFT_643025 [Hypoxylon sp. NC1633]|nr:hypothetical protein GGR54DRAFT_643025 [Hypoxylon sp. NC1633]